MTLAEQVARIIKLGVLDGTQFADIAERIIAIVREEAAKVEQSTDPWSAGLEDADGNELITVLASNYDALLSAVRAAQALATACMAPGCYSHEEIENIARATKPTFDAALDRKLGSAS